MAGQDISVKNAYPTFHDFMTLTGIQGKARKTATILFFAEDGKVKACLNDRDTLCYAFVTGESVLEVLEAIEKGLRHGGLDWRGKKGR